MMYFLALPNIRCCMAASHPAHACMSSQQVLLYVYVCLLNYLSDTDQFETITGTSLCFRMHVYTIPFSHFTDAEKQDYESVISNNYHWSKIKAQHENLLSLVLVIREEQILINWKGALLHQCECVWRKCR